MCVCVCVCVCVCEWPKLAKKDVNTFGRIVLHNGMKESRGNVTPMAALIRGELRVGLLASEDIKADESLLCFQVWFGLWK